MTYEHEKFGLMRVGVAVPNVYVADPERNAREMARITKDAAMQGARLLIFPELAFTSYTCGELFRQEKLRELALEAVDWFSRETKELPMLIFAGAPIRVGGQLFNMGLGFNGGRIVGGVPKKYLAEGNVFYERRYFSPGSYLKVPEIDICGNAVPVGLDLLFRSRDIPDFVSAIEICQDGWTALPPSRFHALNGAMLLGNLSSSPVGIGKADFRRDMCRMHSAHSYAAYLYTSSSSCTTAEDSGECTSDFVNDGHALICENNSVLGETRRFAEGPQLLIRDMDLSRLIQDRVSDPSWGDLENEYKRPYRYAEVNL